MRTNELHAHAKQVKRSDGRSSVAAAAYRSASRLVDDRTGEIHDYTRKAGVEHTRLYAPDNAPNWTQDREALWNACEAKENRSNSCTAHELEVSFPHEFDAMQRREAGDSLSRELVRRYGCAVDIAYHVPTGQNDDRNYHAHILFTTRGFDENTKDGWEKRKFRDLSQDAIMTKEGEKERDTEGNIITRGSREIAELRAFSAHEMNRIAERDNLNVRTEHLSFEQRGIDREASQHLGPKAHDMERNGEATRIGDKNRQIANDNADRAIDHARAADIASQIAQEKWKFGQWAEFKRGELTDAQHLADLDLSQKHDKQNTRLEAQLEKENGTVKANIRAEVQAIERRMEAKGVRKLVRSVFGMQAKDKRNHVELKSTLRGIERREQERRDALKALQKKDLQKEATRQKDNQKRLEKGVSKARARREDEGWKPKSVKPARSSQQKDVPRSRAKVSQDLENVQKTNAPSIDDLKDSTGKHSLDDKRGNLKRPWESNLTDRSNSRPWESSNLKGNGRSSTRSRSRSPNKPKGGGK